MYEVGAGNRPASIAGYPDGNHNREPIGVGATPFAQFAQAVKKAATPLAHAASAAGKAATKAEAEWNKTSNPPKHYVLAKQSDCWGGAKLQKVVASQLSPMQQLPPQFPGAPPRYAPAGRGTYWQGGQHGRSVPLPDYVHHNDFVTVCWQHKSSQSALNTFVDVISAPVTLPSKAVDKAFDAAGIPSPSKMLSKIGVPTPEQITHGHFGAITNPKELLDKIPGIQKLSRYIPSMPDPTKTAAKLMTAVEHGDLEGIKNSALEIGHQVADVASMVPGIGNVIGGPLASAITLLETGSPLKAALSLLLNEIPGIPPQIRGILRVAFNAIADVVEHQKAVTDILLTEFKKGVEDQAKKYGISGPVMHLVEGVINSAVQVIFHHKPLDKAALDLAKKGLNEARKKLGNVPAVKQAESELSDLEDVYKNVNSMHALTQGVKKIAGGVLKNNPEIQKKLKQLAAGQDVTKDIVNLAKKELAKAGPVDAKKLADLKTALEGLKAASHVQAKHIKKRHPPRLVSVRTPVKQPPKLHAPAPKMSAEEAAALQKMTPEQRKALAALTPQQQAELRKLAVAKEKAAKAKRPPTFKRGAPTHPAHPVHPSHPVTPAPPVTAKGAKPAAAATKAAPAPAPGTPHRAYHPYPQGIRGAGVSAPPHGGGGGGHPHGGHPGGGFHPHGGGGFHPHGGAPHPRPHPHGGGFPHFRGAPFSQAIYAGRQWEPWWGVPWTPEVVTTTQTCQTWGDRIEMPYAMQVAAKAALGASQGRPTTVRGPDGVLYLFAYEGGAPTARACAAVATS